MARADSDKKKLRIENLENRRNKILKAGENIFFTKGYRLTTIEEVAKEAGYSKRTVYLDFENKDDLFICVAANGLQILLNNLKKIPIGKFPIQEYFDRYVETIAEFSYEQREYFQMFCVDVTPDMMENCSIETRNRAAEIEIAGFGLIAQEVERAIQEGVMPPHDAWEVAGIFIGSVVGNILLSMGGSQIIFKKRTLIAKVKKTGRLICQGLFAEGPQET